MGMTIRVSRPAFDDLLAEAARAAPEECCGILLGREGAIDETRPTRNLALDPRRRFEIDPQALVDAHRAARAGGPQVVGYFHSHPDGPAEPSATDRAQAEAVWRRLKRAHPAVLEGLQPQVVAADLGAKGTW